MTTETKVMDLFIDGKWQEASGDSFESISPIDESVLWKGKAASAKDVDEAVCAAQKALPAWRKMDSVLRQEYIERFILLLEQNLERMAEILCQENGKSINEASLEVKGMLGKFKVSLDASHNRYPSLEKEMKNAKSITRYKPHGVVAVFGPYNFPGHIPNGHIIPALLAGNTIIFKPSELVPLFSQEMIKLWQAANLPNGVINLVQGQAKTGVALAEHSGIKAIFFTGSSKVGKILHQQAAGQLDKILALELGGNNPMLCHQVNDIQETVEMIIQSAFITNGQRCTCARRLILIEDQEGQDILTALKEKTEAIEVGNPLDKESFMGPVISSAQADKLYQSQASLLEKGAKSIVLMKELVELGASYLSPGIVDCTGIEGISDEEDFGPLLKIFRVKDFQEAIKLANDTSYGLSSALISKSKELYEEFYWAIDAGLINWNQATTGAASTAPFGGVGMSGNYRPSAYFAADYCAYPVASLEAELS